MMIDETGDIAGLQQLLADTNYRDEDLRRTIESISGKLAAIALENARLLEAERRHSARIAIINRIGQLITGSLSITEICQIAVEAIREHLNFAYVAAGLVSSDNPEELILIAHTGTHADKVPEGYRQSIYVGLIGAAARTRKRILVNNVNDDPRYLAVISDPNLWAELAVPIMVGERLVGLLNIESDRPIDEAEADDIDIVADQLGIAIENAKRYEEEKRRTERLALIARISQRIASQLDHDELFQTTIQELHQRLGYDHVSLFLLDPENPDWLVYHAHASRWPRDGAGGYRQHISEGIMGAAARGRAPSLVVDVAHDGRYVPIPGAPPSMSELAVPILLGPRLLGVLDVAGARRFGDEDVTGIQVIADQLGIAIDHAGLFARTQSALTETQLLYETSRRISTAMSVDDVVAAYLNQVATRGRYICTIVVNEADETGELSSKLTLGRWSPDEGLSLERVRIYSPPDALDPLLDAGQTVAIDDVRSHPMVSDDLRGLQERDQRPALALIPLMTGIQRIGLVVLTYPQVYRWSEADLKPYQVTAVQLATAIDSRRQHLLVAERSQRLAVLEERQRLARELHDSVTQSLFSMSLLAQVLPELWHIDQEEAQAGLAQIRDLTRGALSEMRALLFELRPAAMGEHDLAQALRDHAIVFEQRTGIPVTVEVAEAVVIPEQVEQALFRIAQEALANVARHAHARRVRLSLRGGKPILLTIADDGQGFRPDRVGEGRFGLNSMRERATAINARLDIRSHVGQGTKITVAWPARRKRGTKD